MHGLRGIGFSFAVVVMLCGARVEGGYERVIQNLEQIGLQSGPFGSFEWTGHNFGLPQIDGSGDVSVASFSEDGYPPFNMTGGKFYGIRTISAPGTYDWAVLSLRVPNPGDSPAINQFHEMDTLSLRHSIDGHSIFIGKKTNDVFESTRIHMHGPGGAGAAFEFPEIAGQFYDMYSGSALADGGRGVMALEADSQTSGLFAFNTGGTSSVLAYTGQQAVGMDPGVVYDDPGEGSIRRYWVNDNGEGIFNARVTGPGIVNGTAGIWRFGSGGVQLVAESGSALPGLSIEESFVADSFSNAGILNDGSVVISGTIDNPTDDALSGLAIWSDRSGAMEQIVRSGGFVSGAPAGSVFASAALPIVNGSGDIGFWAGIETPVRGGTGTLSMGFFVSDRAGDIKSVFITGDTVEGIGAGVEASINTASSFSDNSAWWGSDDYLGTNMAMNNAGQFAFTVDLAGLGIDDTNDIALVGRDSDGSLHNIIQTGDLVKWDLVREAGIIEQTFVWPVESIEFLGASSGEGGRGTALNDDGWLVFKVTLDDGELLGSTGRPEVILRTRIPAPGTVVVFVLAPIVGMRRRRAG